MKIYTKERLHRMIKRNKAHLKRLQDKQANLSVWGYRDMGYFEGRLSVLEDLLDELEEDDNE